MVDRSKLYDCYQAFFALDGSVIMRLTPEAAAEVAIQAASHELLIWRVEGGVWSEGYFMARVACIWDGYDPPLSFDQANSNNHLAADFIREESVEHNAFILTTTEYAIPDSISTLFKKFKRRTPSA